MAKPRVGRSGTGRLGGGGRLREAGAPAPRAGLSDESLGRLHAFTVALIAREVTTRRVEQDWPEYFDLALSFAQHQGSIELLDALSRTTVFDPEHRGTHRGALNGTERRCFLALARELRRSLVHAPS